MRQIKFFFFIFFTTYLIFMLFAVSLQLLFKLSHPKNDMYKEFEDFPENDQHQIKWLLWIYLFFLTVLAFFIKYWTFLFFLLNFIALRLILFITKYTKKYDINYLSEKYNPIFNKISENTIKLSRFVNKQALTLFKIFFLIYLLVFFLFR